MIDVFPSMVCSFIHEKTYIRFSLVSLYNIITSIHSFIVRAIYNMTISIYHSYIVLSIYSFFIHRDRVAVIYQLFVLSIPDVVSPD